MQIILENKKNIKEIITALKNGAVLVLPTDTVYGFVADATNKKAVDKIFKIKKRPKSKPLPVFIKNLKMAKGLAFIDEEQKKIIIKKWPGKYTFVLNRKKGLKLYGVKKDTIALRMPKYKFLNEILNKLDKPIVQTSVNVSDTPPLVKISDIINQFNKSDILLVDVGNFKKSKPSKILDLTKNNIKIIRN